MNRPTTRPRRRPSGRRTNPTRLAPAIEGLEARQLLAVDGLMMSSSGAVVAVDQRVADRIGDDLAFLATDFHRWSTTAPTSTAVGASYVPASDQPQRDIIRFSAGGVGVAAVADSEADTAAVAAAIAAIGGRVTGQYGVMVSAVLPYGSLTALAGVNDLRFARPDYLPVSNSGKVDNQAVPAQKSDVASKQFSVNGAGVTVGILSDSFNNRGGYAAGVASGDLPAGVNVLADLGGSGSDEGRGMAELVYDVAPGSSLAFSSAFISEAAFASGIVNLAKPVAQGGAGAKVVVDDVFYLSEPIFQDGIVAQAVDTAATTYGASYFSSAGNQASQAFQTAWNPTTASPNGMPVNSTVQNFGGANGIFLPLSGALQFTFQWDSAYASAGNGSPGSNNQLDLYFYAADKTTLIGSFTSNTIGADPTRIIQGNVGASAYMVVRLASGPAPTTFKYIQVSSGAMPFNAGASFGHNQAAGGAGVAAAPYGTTPAYGVNPPLPESFTSAGGTPILFSKSGVRLAAPDQRQQPRFTGVDGTDTTFFGNDADGNGLPNFFGTSAAAPNVAAVAALMKQAVPTLTPAQIYAALAATAIDMGAAGYDFTTGAGLIQANSALINVTNNSISGQVFRDVNGDGTKNGADSGQSGRTVFLDSNSNGVIDSGTTAALASSDVPKAVPDGVIGTPSRVTSSLNVSGVPGRVTKVTVRFSLTHTFDSDLGLTLISPSGMRVPLVSQAGGSADNFTNTVLDDAAATSVQSASAPFTGTFRPQVALAALIGENPNGTWQLEARDYFATDTGTVQSWSITIGYAETSTTTDASGNYTFAGLAPSSYYGAYNVRTVAPAGFTLSAPASPYNITLTNLTPVTGRDFGLFAAAAALASVTVDDGTAQRSMVRKLTLRFNGVIPQANILAGAFSVVQTGGTIVPFTTSILAVSNPTPTTTDVVLGFTGAGLSGGSLADGTYTLTVDGSKITDANGSQVDAAGNGTAGSTRTVNFIRFFGDSNGDGVVDAGDFLAFRTAYNSGVVTPANSIFDVDGNGQFTAADLQAFNDNYRKRRLVTPV